MNKDRARHNCRSYRNSPFLHATPMIGLHASLVAQENGLLQFVESFHKNTETAIDPRDVAIWTSAIALVALVIWVLSIFSARYREHKPYRSSWNLFLDLARSQGLPWSECWLLWRLARSHRLQEPSLIFLEPDRFLPKNLPSQMKPRARPLQSIADRLFAEPVAPEPQVEKPKLPIHDGPPCLGEKPTEPVAAIAKTKPAAKPRPTPASSDLDAESPLAGIDFSLPPTAPGKPTAAIKSKPQESGPSENGAACDFVASAPPSLDSDTPA